MQVERVIKGLRIAEAPVWEASSQTLYFSDAMAGGVHALRSDGTVEEIIPHRRGIGGLALHRDGGMVISGRTVVHKRGAETTATYLVNDDDNGAVGYSDMIVDSAGRIYVGSVGEKAPEFGGSGSGAKGSATGGQTGTEKPRNTGWLFMIDVDGSGRIVADDIWWANGVALSPDERILYFSDTRRRVVFAYDRSDDGVLSGRRVLAELKNGISDGLAVSQDGAVWIAAAYAGEVVVYEPDGTLRQRISMPTPMVTSLGFGGPELRDLYVTAGYKGAPEEIGGALYRVRVDVAGLAVPYAGVSTSVDVEPVGPPAG